MNKLLRLLMAFTLLSLSACMATEDIIPLDVIEKLEGRWSQENGSAAIHFYNDDNLTIKFTIKDQQPPFRVLTTLETLQDGFAFSLGNRWQKPVEVIMLDDQDRIDLLMPGDEPRQVLHMKRAQ